jgi:hypothetical protein
MIGTKLSIRQISIVTALDRDTVTRRLQGLQSEPGAKNARMYEAPAALRAVLAPALAPEGTLEQIKVRNETLNAQLKELELAKKTQGLIPAQFSFSLIDTFIKFCAGKFEELRRRGVVDRSWISKCEGHWNSLYREFIRNYDLSFATCSNPSAIWKTASSVSEGFQTAKFFSSRSLIASCIALRLTGSSGIADDFFFFGIGIKIPPKLKW